jgi:hypothetical protein
VKDLRLAPFHVLATEGAVPVDRDHLWHMEQTRTICAAEESGVLFTTAHRMVDLIDPASEQDATIWWEEMTGKGGEGMVVKPLGFVARPTRDRAAGGEVPGARISAHHLRAGVHATGESATTALSQPLGQAVARTAGVRVWSGGAGAIRPQGATATSA